MNTRTDEEILYYCYCRLGEKNAAKTKIVDAEKDRSMVSGITSKSSLMLMRLTSDDLNLSASEIQKYVMSVKGLYIQYAMIKGRNPRFVSPCLDKNMNKLIRAVCKHEADMIAELRLQETGGDRIDIKSIFDQKRNLNLLGNTIARVIVSEAVKDQKEPTVFTPKLYITNSGRRYHLWGCPYCKGKHLSLTTRRMIENQKLTPCKCLSVLQTNDIEDSTDCTCVTAFIDESIRPLQWGEEGKAGSYSYIICKGNLADESQITDDRLIVQGVDFIGEFEHIERITESAVGKVLITLAYDYGFTGKVHIFTDNQPVVNLWQTDARNSRLARIFRAVKVSFIPREKNRMADKLGRTRIMFDMPIEAYKKAVKNTAGMCSVFSE